jgi:hypothetical protein
VQPVFFVFLKEFLFCSQSGKFSSMWKKWPILSEDLVKPGYEPDMKVQNPNCPSISVATHSKLNIEIW